MLGVVYENSEKDEFPLQSAKREERGWLPNVRSKRLSLEATGETLA